MKNLFKILILSLLVFSCDSPTKSSLCDESIEVELWGECYNIENTTVLTRESGSLTGEIPPEIGKLINLDRLSLGESNLSGEIPPEIGNLTNLTRLYLSHNTFSGGIPPEIGNLTNLIYLYANQSNLSGEIPPEIGNLINLEIVHLEGNHLSGEIPVEICNQGDSTPNLDSNELCPPYPECLSVWAIGGQDTSNCPED